MSIKRTKNIQMNKFILNAAVLTVAMASIISCRKTAAAPQFTLTNHTDTIAARGGTKTISFTTNKAWRIDTTGLEWLKISPVSGNAGDATVQITVTDANATGASRSKLVYVSADNGQARRVTIYQYALIYPSYNTSPKAPDSTGMSTAVQLAAKFKMGWNIGNTLEAPNGETGWGNPQITESYIKFVKQQGFTAIRLPCAWNWTHLSDENTAKIDPDWLNRVKEIVGYCVKNDMYVMLNIHWDGGWLEKNITKQKQDSVGAKQKAFWEQIATTMRDFDEHLMFASANEPAADDAEAMEVLASHHQTFVNAVRSTGGKNSHRVLIVQGPNTNSELTYNIMNTLPVDPTANRLMVEVHNYLPSQFCFLNEDVSWGKMAYYWGKGYHSTIEPDRNATYGEEDAHIADYNRMKTKFVDKGIPVIMGEYGAYRRDRSAHVPKDLALHNASVDYWITFTTKEALSRGIKPFWWDIGAALDRSQNIVKDQRTIDALKAAL